MSDKSGQLVTEDLPDDVEGAESLLVSHAEHKVEIDAHNAQFEASTKEGEALVHYAASEVSRLQTRLCVHK